MIRLFIALSFAVSLVASAATSINEPNGTKEVVVSYNPVAAEAGYRILRSGGNAFDAFVATTMAEYVLAEGVTSAAGPLGALVYHAKSGETLYLDGYWNNVKDPEGRWRDDAPIPGKAILVPGAIRALEALSKRFGNLQFAESLQPALELARDGFIVSPLYANLIQYSAEILQRSEYGRQTFFPNGKALVAGDRLNLPKVANFLMSLQREGSDYMYKGFWARQMVELVKAQGGKMTPEDLSSYEVKWFTPLKTTYRGYEVVAPGGRNYGGYWALMALKTLEHWTPTSGIHYSTSADDLETLVQTAIEIHQENWLFEMENLDRPELLLSKIHGEHPKKIWDRVKSKISTPVPRKTGTHSYHVIVSDKDGNAVTGTHTINSYPWGDGNFVEGIVLSNAGGLPGNEYFYGETGGRGISPLSMHLVFRDGGLKFATGAFNSSLVEAELQFLVNLMDYGLNAIQAMDRPRFGGFHMEADGTTKVLLSPRISTDIVAELEKRGLRFHQQGDYVDTGLGGALIIHENGSKEGAISNW